MCCLSFLMGGSTIWAGSTNRQTTSAPPSFPSEHAFLNKAHYKSYALTQILSQIARLFIICVNYVPPNLKKTTFKQEGLVCTFWITQKLIRLQMTILAESCNFCLLYASDNALKVNGCVCVKTNPNLNSNPSNETFNVRSKIMNHYSLLECRQSIIRLHRHKPKHASSHTSSYAYLSSYHNLLSDGSCSSIRSGSHSVGMYPWCSPQSTNFIPSQSFRPFIYIKERDVLAPSLSSAFPLAIFIPHGTLLLEFSSGHPHTIPVITSYCDNYFYIIDWFIIINHNGIIHRKW